MRRQEQQRKEFAQKLRGLSGRFNTWEIWSDFVMMFAIAISNAFDKSHYDAREETYLKIINKYDEKERMVFPELVVDVTNALESDPEQDFLGSVYMELELGNHWIGQFFTPYSICKCMAALTSGNEVEQIERDGYIIINDCACGAGATLIAAVNQIDLELSKAESPLHWQDHVLVTAQDIDLTTGLMCYIQLSLLGCAGYVKIGNTLTDPMHSGDDLSNYWFMPGYFRSVWHYRRVFHSMDALFNRRNEHETK
ncbi:MAG: N-6 DNA methylase [Paludibacteraceae bacterium]